MGLILALTRHIPAEDRQMRAGGWQHTIGPELAGRTLGLLGLGRLGKRMARIAAGFEMPVIAWSQNLTAEDAAASGAELVGKDELFARADVVSIHVRLSGRTRGLVGAAELARMKPGAVLINTSRGPIVDAAALLAARHDGQLAGAGLDVYDTEPLPPGHPLRHAPNTVLTPHIGYVTTGTYDVFYGDAAEDVAAWLRGAPVRVISEWQACGGGGMSSVGLRSKNPTGSSEKPALLPGMTGQSSGRTKCVTPTVYQSTTSSFSSGRSVHHSGSPRAPARWYG